PQRDVGEGEQVRARGGGAAHGPPALAHRLLGASQRDEGVRPPPAAAALPVAIARRREQAERPGGAFFGRPPPAPPAGGGAGPARRRAGGGGIAGTLALPGPLEGAAGRRELAGREVDHGAGDA